MRSIENLDQGKYAKKQLKESVRSEPRMNVRHHTIGGRGVIWVN